MRLTRSAHCAVATLLVALAACTARKLEEGQTGSTSCTKCHGGTDNATGAPPRDIRGSNDTSSVSVGAHTSHLSAPHGVAAPVACESCHDVPSPGAPRPTHGDGQVEVSFNAFASHGVAQPRWDRASRTCNVYCHGATLSGGTVTAPDWTQLDGSQRACGSCHGAPPDRPHVQRSDCATCHPATVNASGIIPGGAHLDGDVDIDYSAMGCTDCHGDAQRGQPGLQRIAPPIGTHGETSTDTIAVGAHQAHVAKASIAPALACTECHVFPSSPAHSNDVVDIAFGPLATGGGSTTPVWNRAGPTCSSTYCHGATLDGGSISAPVWTAGASQAACGSCHGVPPRTLRSGSPHPQGTGCHACHPSTVDANGALILAAHVNGTVEAQKVHPAGWASPTSHGYAANADLATCKTCHGASLDGGSVGISCDACHTNGTPAWRTTCTFCHGDVQRADAIEAAPPVGTQGELATTDRAVGAHQKHLVDGAIRAGVACTECHAVPTDMMQPQHVNGSVDLTFGPLATANTTAASFDTTNLTCTNYCHGATLSGGTAKQPFWTLVDGSQDDCDDCHGSPPPLKADGTPHPALTTCRACHSLTVLADAPPAHTIDVAGGHHINGTAEATEYHEDPDWTLPTHHGYAANRDFASCKACHGADLNGGDVGVSCNQCHANNGHAGWQTECTFCHGDAQRAANQPAPPVGTQGQNATTERAVGAHQAHLSGAALGKAIACTECHALPTDTSHLNGTATLTWGTLATAQQAAASFNPADLSCSNYCHGATLAGGSRPNPVWTAANQAQCGACHGLPPPAPHPSATVACYRCHLDTLDTAGNLIAGGQHLDGTSEARAHDAAWMNPATPGFHAYEANAGLAACQACHGVNLDGPSPQSACTACHHSGGPAPDFGTGLTRCTGCHGGTNDQSGAPPRATWGNAGDPVRVGAHAAHLSTDVAPPIACASCHVTPASGFAAGHIDPSPAEVVFSGVALGGSWNRAGPTCTVYCHGATLAGGDAPSPVWTGGAGQGDCGSCHGLPPATVRDGSAHPVVSSDPAVCSACHPQTVASNGTIIPPSQGGLHLDGAAQATFGHDAAWMDRLSPQFHAYSADQGLSSCQVCHGPNLDGGAGAATTVGCDDCHRSGGPAPILDCTGCHGGTDNSTGAPPRVQWAFRGNAAEASLRTGAHTTHVTLSAIAPPIDCSVCHERPADMFAPGHIDQATSADVVFGGLAVIGGTPPQWNRAAPTCTVYCHGATLASGGATPDWTRVGQGEAACGTCHGVPPTNPQHPPVSGDLVGCHDCHPETIDAAGAVIPPISPISGGKHLNGQIDGGHTEAWMSPADESNLEFHAYSANRGLTSCQFCHGPLLDGVGGTTTVACTDCHNSSPTGTAPPFYSAVGEPLCTGCHGGTDNQTGAPPRATWGNTSLIAIGAHSSHVGTNPVSAPIDCTGCHTKPTDMFTPGHVDDAVTVAFQGGVGTWNYPTSGTPTCSSTYCHGNFPRGTATNTPNWTGTNQAACGSCHPARPLGFLHTRHQRQDYTGIEPWWPQPGQSGWVTCDQCHSGIAQSVTNVGTPTLVQVNGGGPPLHVNGTANVVFKLGGTYTSDAFQGTCSSMACHPGEVMTWPK